MTQRGAEQVERLRDDVTCPSCEYPLRGLPGDIVTCPECGQVTSLASLLQKRWQRPWYEVPRFSQLLQPLVFITLGPLIALPVIAIEAQSNDFSVAGLMILAGSLLGWGSCIWQRRNLLDAGRAFPMIALAHAIMGGYLFGIVLLGVSLMRGFASGSLLLLAAHSVIALPGVVLMVVCRRGERYIARQCLRQYLMEEAGSARVDADEPEGRRNPSFNRRA